MLGGVASLPFITNIRTTTDKIIVERVKLNYPDLPKDLVGTRIGFITDIHLGGWVPNELASEALKNVLDEKPDLLLFGGDYIWVPDTLGGNFNNLRNETFQEETDEGQAVEIYKTLSKILSPLKKTTAYGVLGNHDRWSHPTAYRAYLPKAGLPILQNDTVYFERGDAKIEVYGTEDLWTGVPSLGSTHTTPDTFRIFLTHNPDYASYAYHVKKYPFHLSLSGHTHGGQIVLPIIGAFHYNIQDTRYASGLVDYGERKFYTSRGIGVVELPFRINCPPEVTIFELV